LSGGQAGFPIPGPIPSEKFVTDQEIFPRQAKLRTELCDWLTSPSYLATTFAWNAYPVVNKTLVSLLLESVNKMQVWFHFTVFVPRSPVKNSTARMFLKNDFTSSHYYFPSFLARSSLLARSLARARRQLAKMIKKKYSRSFKNKRGFIYLFYSHQIALLDHSHRRPIHKFAEQA
jgi:hypothetical protein